MSTTSMSTVNAAAGPAWTQAAAGNQASVALPDGSFSSQVAAIWNQSPSSPGAAGSASSAGINDRPVTSSAPASRTPGRAGNDGTSERKAAQVKPPASRSQTMQPASARECRPAIETRGRGTPDVGTEAADTAGGIEDDALTTDAPQPGARAAAGAPAKSLHKLSQATGARPDDGTAAPALQPELPAGAPAPPAHLPDIATEPTNHGLSGGGVTASDRKDPTDDSRQQTITDPAYAGRTMLHHPLGNEAAGTGTGARSPEHHDDMSGRGLSDRTQAVDLSAANNTSAANLLSMMELTAPATNLVDPSLAVTAGMSADAGPAMASASAVPLDTTAASAQVGTSLLTLASGTDGSSQMALSLHPKDLGDVHIQLARDADGAVRVVVAATEPATLRSLINDQAHLHAALDAAAVPSADRHVSFELAPAAAPSNAGTTSDRQPDNPGSPDGRTAMDMSDRNGGGRSGDRQPGRPDGQAAAGTPGDGLNRSSSSTRTLLLRHGSINITA